MAIKKLADIKKIKSLKGPDIQVWGSGELIQLLLKNDLVDELKLKIHPLTLGKGRWSDHCQLQASWKSQDRYCRTIRSTKTLAQLQNMFFLCDFGEHKYLLIAKISII